MKKMLNAMLDVQKEMVLEKDAIEVDLVIISYVLEETTYILQDLISQCKFEEAKGFLDDCSKLQQKKKYSSMQKSSQSNGNWGLPTPP